MNIQSAIVEFINGCIDEEVDYLEEAEAAGDEFEEEYTDDLLNVLMGVRDEVYKMPHAEQYDEEWVCVVEDRIQKATTVYANGDDATVEYIGGTLRSILKLT